MMEQSTQTNNYERPKKKVGRPKGTGLFTDEENKERARMRSRLYYSLNIEIKGKKTIRTSSETVLFKIICFNVFIVLNFHLNNWQPNYIIGDLQNYTRSPLPKVKSICCKTIYFSSPW